jgi:hypothetical protein
MEKSQQYPVDLRLLGPKLPGRMPHVLCAVLGFSLAVVPVPAPAQTPDCYASLKAYAITNPELHCTCSGPNSMPACSRGGAGSGYTGLSTKAMVQQEIAATVVQSFIQMLFSNNSQANAQKQKMMEELKQRQAEAERQHKIEEAKRLAAICAHLESTLKLSGLPSLQLKGSDNSSAGLKLKLGNENDDHVGIKGLPGIALNDNSGNGGNTPYGIQGLPGIYTNGPRTASAQQGDSKLQLKTGDETSPPAQPGTAISAVTSAAPSGANEIPADLAAAMRNPETMTPQQLADAATLINNLPPEQQQQLMNAVRANPQVTNGGIAAVQPAASQLQQTANASQMAANAKTPEEAAALARVGFDQAAPSLPTPTPATAASVPATQPTLSAASVPTPLPTTNTTVNSAAPVPHSASQPTPAPAIMLNPSTAARSDAPRNSAQQPDKVARAACPPGIKRMVPSREELLTELAVRRAQMDSLRNTILRLNRSIQMDQQQFAVWQDEAESALTRVKGRLWNLSTQAIFNSFVDQKEEYFAAKKAENKLTAFDRDQMRKLERAKDLNTFNAFKDWALANKDELEMVEEAARQIADTFPLTMEAKSYIRAGEALIDNAYDFTDLVATWENVQRLDHNSTQFLEAVHQNGERMKALVNRIQEIQAQLNSMPAASPGALPCTQIQAASAR